MYNFEDGSREKGIDFMRSFVYETLPIELEMGINKYCLLGCKHVIIEVRQICREIIFIFGIIYAVWQN